MKLRHKLFFCFCLITLLLLVSCQSEMESILASSPTVVIATTTTKPQPTLASPTASLLLPITTVTKMVETTSVSVPDPTIPPPASGLVTPASISSKTPAIVAATLTPLATLEGKVLETRVAELLKDPMNCEVPCWWGAIPGTTTVDDIKHSISPYNFDIYEYEENGELVHLRYGIGYIEETNGFEVKVAYNFSNDLLTGVTAYSSSIAEQLAEFGQPDEIWLTVVDFEGLLVRLNLVYLQKGMAVGFVVDGYMQENLVIGCFANEETGLLRLVELNTATSYKEFTPIFDLDRRYLPLEEASPLTMDEFTQQFGDPSQPQCIETPIELWE